MQIALGTLRLLSLIAAVLTSVVLLPEFSGAESASAVMLLPGVLLVYMWGLAITLCFTRLASPAGKRGWQALAPLGLQLGIYCAYATLRVVGLAEETGPAGLEIIAVLAILAFLFGFPIALPVGLVCRRAEALIAIEGLGPVLLLLALALAAALS